MASPTSPHLVRHLSQRSSSPSSSGASDGPPTHPTQQSVDGRRGYDLDQSSPSTAMDTSDAPRAAANMGRSRTHSQGGVPSHSLVQPSDAHRGQTWMDFLRDYGSGTDPDGPQRHAQQPQPNLHAPLPPLPPESFPNRSSSRYSLPARPQPPAMPYSSRSSSDRKRRLTTAESHFRRPSSTRMRSESEAGTSENPIVLGSSPVAPTAPRQAHPGTVRRDSDFVLPRWQPDSEVTHCFVCGSQFTFFFRKHHCRKCGRVVCSACSPHRITIPRQYIVHPPHDNPNLVHLIGDDDQQMSRHGPFGNPALGGGEEVRVCNPCVPDPNYSPPPQHGQTSPFPPFSPTAHSPHLHRPHQSSHRSTQSVNGSGRAFSHGQARTRDPFTDRRTSYHNSTRVADLWPPPPEPPHAFAQPPGYDHRARPHSRSLVGSSNLPPDFANFDGQNMSGHRRGTHGHGHQAPAPAPPQPPPRRQIAEEDECPVCGNELPPKGADGDESARTQHVEDCIALYSGRNEAPQPPTTTPSDQQTSTSLPSQRTRGMSSAAGNGEGSSTRLNLSMRGLVPYVATEKDCIDGDGKEVECVICLEDFEAGDKMARLVCWCKFHEACIREWWDKKGRGACPTHQLQY